MGTEQNCHHKPLIRLSQAQLNLLETCPPQFQRLYIEQLGLPISPEIQENLSWGSQFHQLMQQRELGLPVEGILGEDRQFQQAVTALVEAVKAKHDLTPESWKEAEHCRALKFQEYLLTVIYDLLIIEENRAQILDWKTYLQPQNSQKLARNWQTRLYLYLLAETSDYLPEQISMTYWFVKIPHQPQFLAFNYNHEEHQKNRQDLSQLLTLLDNYLESYQFNQTNFLHQNKCQECCPYYQLFLAQETSLEEKENNWLSLLDEIEEVSI